MSNLLTILPHEHHVAFESFGVRVALSTNDARALQRFPLLAPAQSQPCEVAAAEHHLTVTTKDGLRFNAQYEVHGEAGQEIEHDIWLAGDADLELTLAHLDKHVHECIALNAPEHLFLRGGSVVHHGRAIVVLGEALAGTSTLVAALMRAGATYYSDGYAVFDEHARVHRYTGRSAATPTSSATNGDGGRAPGSEGEPRDVDAIVVTSYTPGIAWEPERLSRGERMLALLAYAVPAEDRPQHAMQGIARILEGDPLVIRGERGEADAVAPVLLADAELQRSGAA
jgi:hypothetical protein